MVKDRMGKELAPRIPKCLKTCGLRCSVCRWGEVMVVCDRHVFICFCGVKTEFINFEVT